MELPAGVTPSDWAVERTRVQNPRIRSFLGCTRLLEEVLDSNYAILHCSPERLLKIWRQIRQVRRLIGTELAPTLKAPSVIPDLEAARGHALLSLQALNRSVLDRIDEYPERVPAAQLPEVREHLCIWIGKIHAFLRDSFGEVVASDPRSRHNADYFLSKRFAQDIEESEWLYSSVYDLCDYLDGLVKVCAVEFEQLLATLRRERMIPDKAAWSSAKALLETLRDELTGKLREVLTLRGIRFDDMKSLEAFARGISQGSISLLEVHEVGRDVVERVKAAGGATLDEREQSVRDLIQCHEAACDRMIDLTSTLHATLQDLATYAPAWMASVENRRALMWSKAPGRGPAEEAGPVRLSNLAFE